MKCPNCNNNIAWYKILVISRWTSIECPKCNTLYNRRIDLQVLFILLLSYVGLLGCVLSAVYISTFWGIASGIILGMLIFLILALLIKYIDAQTIRLAAVEKRQGFKAILGHKYIKKDKNNI
jgi:CXXC-20-CXXC protein